MAHSHAAHREHKASKARVKHILGHKGGGAAHPDEAADRKLFGKMIKEHEAKETKMEGHKSGGRLDKYARGGATKHKGKHHTQVNVIVAPHRGSPSPGGDAPAGAGAVPPPPLPGGPPPGGPPPMMPPPGGGGMPPMKRGGRAYARGGKIGMTAGAESGEGRLQKAHKYSKKN